MNSELQSTLNDALVSVIEGAATAKDFILAETPEVVEQLLAWHLFKYGLLMGVGVLLLLSVGIYWRFVVKKWEWMERNCIEVVFVVGGAVGTAFATIIAFSECINITWLQILIAPKLYLLEYAASLVK